MPGPYANPLNEHAKQVLNGVCQSCDETKWIIDKMAAAGLPVEQHHQDNEFHRSIAKGLLDQFFVPTVYSGQ